MDLTKKGEGFKWEIAQKEAFKRIKTIVVSKPIVMILDLNRLFEVKLNVLKHTVGATLG